MALDALQAFEKGMALVSGVGIQCGAERSAILRERDRASRDAKTMA